MGHANLSNISEFFINRLYAKGTLSIHDCVQALMKAGETLHASEGQYSDESMLAMGLMDVIHYLTRTDPTRLGYSGPRGGGPWIWPVFSVHPAKGIKVSREARNLLRACGESPMDTLVHAVAADKLIDEEHPEWAERIRALPRQREIFRQWEEDEMDRWDSEEYETFDSIRWAFCPGWRTRYRDVPRLGNVTH